MTFWDFWHEHWFLAWCALWLGWGVIWLAVEIALIPFRIVNLVLRAWNLHKHGWPPAHLDADGSWRPKGMPMDEKA